MDLLSERIKGMVESSTLAMAAKAREMKQNGFDVISLSLGEPDFKTPKHIQEGAKKAIDDGKYFSYAPVNGYLDLREAISEKFKKENPGKTEDDYIKEIRLGLGSGGKVIDFAKYKKDNDWHKATRKLDLASLFPEGKTLNSLTDKEKAAVNKLLKLTLGSKD